VGLLEQHTRIPTVRDVGRAIEPVAILAGSEDVFGRHATRRAYGEIIHAHELADGLGLGRNLKPSAKLSRRDTNIVIRWTHDHTFV
jgi:hypothetical protein